MAGDKILKKKLILFAYCWEQKAIKILKRRFLCFFSLILVAHKILKGSWEPSVETREPAH